MSRTLSEAMGAVERQLRSGAPLRPAGKKVDEDISQLQDVVAAMQRGMRVMAIGIDCISNS